MSVQSRRGAVESNSRRAVQTSGWKHEEYDQPGMDRIVGGAIVVTIIVLIAMYFEGRWVFPLS